MPAQGRGPARSRSGREETHGHAGGQASTAPHARAPHRASTATPFIFTFVPGGAIPAPADRRRRLRLHRTAVPYWLSTTHCPQQHRSPSWIFPPPVAARSCP
jgi:hypothetical protein